MTNELTYRIIAISLLFGMKLIRARTQKIAGNANISDALKQNPLDTTLLLSMSIFWSLSVAIYAVLPQWIDWASLELDDWLRWVGVAFGIGSVALLAWSDHHLGRNFSPILRIRNEHTLVQTGPYRWVRHPIYTSGMLFVIAMLLVSSNWFVGLCWSSLLVLYVQRVSREEAMMLEQFGEQYRDYMQKSGRLIPRIFR